MTAIPNKGTIWTATANLRFVERYTGGEYRKTLQQLWQEITTGETRWEDVPCYDEDEVKDK